MSELRLRLRNAMREPLDDIVDVTVTDMQTRRVVSTKRGVRAKSLRPFSGLTPSVVHLVEVHPLRHYPVRHFARTPASGVGTEEFYCPVQATRATPAFPPYASLPAPLTKILDVGGLEEPANVAGAALYDALTTAPVPLPCAGLLNIFAKASVTGLADGSSVWDHITALYRIRGDRIFADVSSGLRDLVKVASEAGIFREVSGALHGAPDGFETVDSFKTDDRYGNLQVTFFARVGGPIQFKADIDIDDAGGLAHIFQVLGHWVTAGDTHPYDIHQILTFYQHSEVPYELSV